ncbi:hypothetical protein GCM10007094_32280 [Pseudovibrio japonicus]|uniref:Integral membrane protein n=1 Tax=Pseudovibrio japonicus TaxID=366534 RepID=A0ABQ3EHW3_9HYPH|nr:hypothetical protein [Pseudovibrio japonicus]GHB40476.1 hypothetical protein GCM10007094_32280 [Pseudovibrio japonicus]
MSQVHGVGQSNQHKPEQEDSFSLSRFLLTNPVGFAVMLLVQLVAIALITKPDLLHICEVAFMLIIFFTGAVLLLHTVIPSNIFIYFWSGFIYGGFGMLIGHKIDLTIDSELARQQLNSLALAAVYLNWMTLIMVFACIVACLLADHCKGHPATTGAKLLIHAFAVSMMMFGVYVGHALNLMLHENSFDRFYMQVLFMSLFFTIGYYCAIRCYDILRERKKA